MNTNPPLLDKNKIKSIAIFRPVNLGEMLCAVPAFRSLRKAFPTAKISLIGLPWAQEFNDRYQDYFDEFIPFPGFPGLTEKTEIPQKVLGFLQEMQNKKFDLALQMHGDGTNSNPVVVLMNAALTTGFFAPKHFHPDGQLFFPYPNSLKEILRWQKLMEYLQIPSQGDHIDIPVTDAERQSYMRLAKTDNLAPGTYVILHPGSRRPQRRWSAANFTKTADMLMSRGYPIVFTGTENEHAVIESVVKSLPSQYINLAGKTTLGSLTALIKDARLLIANDTAVSQISAATQTPSIILYQGSDPRRWAPLNKDLHKAVDARKNDSLTKVLQETEKIIVGVQNFVPSAKSQHPQPPSLSLRESHDPAPYTQQYSGMKQGRVKLEQKKKKAPQPQSLKEIVIFR